MHLLTHPWQFDALQFDTLQKTPYNSSTSYNMSHYNWSCKYSSPYNSTPLSLDTYNLKLEVKNY
jgi:hypothetical protein